MWEGERLDGRLWKKLGGEARIWAQVATVQLQSRGWAWPVCASGFGHGRMVEA